VARGTIEERMLDLQVGTRAGQEGQEGQEGECSAPESGRPLRCSSPLARCRAGRITLGLAAGLPPLMPAPPGLASSRNRPPYRPQERKRKLAQAAFAAEVRSRAATASEARLHDIRLLMRL
jgi:hypothetical protein